MQAAVRIGGAGQAPQQLNTSPNCRMGTAASPNVQRVVLMQRVRPNRNSWTGLCNCSSRTSTLQRKLSTRKHGVVTTQPLWLAKSTIGQHSRPALVAAAAAQSVHADIIKSEWTAPCGTVFEIMELRSQQQHQQHQHHHHHVGSSSSKPAVVLIHGLFRAAWYWTETLMPQLAAAGHDSYALSLRGQGSSQLIPAAAADQQQQQPSASNSSSAKHPFKHGVPLAVNVADIGAFISSRGFTEPPILIGHSLGGMFVQEYLHTLIWQQQRQQHGLAAAAAADHTARSLATPAAAAAAAQAPATPAAAAAAALPHIDHQLPQLSGAVLLASACAGTVMSFGRFIADVGVLEFMYQMYIVLSHAHLTNISTARYCWWGSDMSEEEAQRHLEMIQKSSSVLPYITAEVGGWYPPAPTAAELALLPPVLALGGSADRIIRPFQVSAAGDYWDADVRILDGVTHDVLLGPQASWVSDKIVSWLQLLPTHSKSGAADGAMGPKWQGLGRHLGDEVDSSVGRLV